MEDQEFSVFIFDNALPENNATRSFAIAIRGDVVVSGYGILPRDVKSLMKDKIMSYEKIANRFDFYSPTGKKDLTTRDSSIQRLLGNDLKNNELISYEAKNYPAGKFVLTGAGNEGFSIGQHKINMI